MGVINFLLLSSLGLAITTQAQNCPPPVGENMSLKGDDINLQTFADGTTVSFACNIGYISAGGSPSVTCTAGNWSTVKLICKRRNCGPAGEVLNGHINYPDGTEFGDKLVVTCNPGHRLVGKAEIICGAQGWLNRLPECEVVACNPPSSVDHGTFSPKKDTFVYDEVVQFSCQNDYTLVGSKSVVCSDSGMFVPAPPTCVLVECEDYEIKDGGFVEGSRPPHRYMNVVMYKCNPGFTMNGSATITCGIDSKWSPGLPTCKRILTTVKPTTARSTTTTTPTAGTVPTTPPGNNGNSKSIGLGIGLTVVGILLTVCGCYFCGVPAMIKEKRRSRRDYPDNVAPKDGEELALS